MRSITLGAAVLVAVSSPAAAQLESHPWRPGPEARAFGGAFIPTNAQRSVLSDAVFVGGQLGYEVWHAVTLVGSFGWSPNNDVLRVYQYDFGGEFALTRPMSKGWTFRPYLGAGVGGITYDFRDQVTESQTYLTGYGAVGAEFELYSLAVRLEARDYLSDWKGLDGKQPSSIRNHVTLALGTAFHFFH